MGGRQSCVVECSALILTRVIGADQKEDSGEMIWQSQQILDLLGSQRAWAWGWGWTHVCLRLENPSWIFRWG